MTTPARLFLSLILFLSACQAPSQALLEVPAPSDPVSIQPLHHLPTPLVLGVLPFDVHGALAASHWLSRGLPEMLTTDLGSAGTLTIVDHARLATIQREITRQYRGQISDESLIRLGRQLGTTVLVTGTIFSLSPTELRLDIRLTSVETSALLTSFSTVTQASDLLTAERHIVMTILALLKATPQHPIATLTSPSHLLRVEALRSYVSGTQALTDQHYQEAQAAFRRALRIDPTFAPAQDSLGDPRLTSLIDTRWEPEIPVLTPLSGESHDAIQQLLQELLTYGLRLHIEPPATHTASTLTVTATLNAAWVQRFSETLPLLDLGVFREWPTPDRPIRVLTSGSNLTVLAGQIQQLTARLALNNATGETLGAVIVCLGLPTSIGSPLIATTHPTPTIHFRSERPFRVPLSLPREFWPLIQTIVPTLSYDPSLCRNA